MKRLILAFLAALPALANAQGEVADQGFFTSDLKIRISIFVLGIILVFMFVFLFSLERRLKKLENNPH